MTLNRRFGKLLSEGITSVARRQSRTIASVERELAESLGYSAHTVQRWRRGYTPRQLDQVVAQAGYCLSQGRLDRRWAQSLLHHAGHPEPEAVVARLDPESGVQARHIFLCYGRGIEPDVSLALQLAQHLSRQHQVFFDQAHGLTRESVTRLHRELMQAEFLVALLSAESVLDEVVQLEIESAISLAERSSGAPTVLPVRVAYREPFPDALGRYLNTLPWALWQEEADTPVLFQAIERAVEGTRLPRTGSPEPLGPLETAPRAPAAIPAPLPAVSSPVDDALEGTVPLRSEFYVQRESDTIALRAIARRNVTLTIKGPRQMGKSSLLIRVGRAAEELGKRTVFLDFQLLRPAFPESTTFFQQFCALLSHGLGQEHDPATFWRAPLPNPFLCTEFVEKRVLPALDRPMLLAMDDVDSLFSAGFHTEFFGMLRVWHNNRAFRPDWRLLDLALVTSSEPYFFIANLSQSPFNVGEVIELRDFDRAQIEWLNERHERPLDSSELDGLTELLHGHPYLVRRALALVANGRTTASTLFRQATDEDGPFADHLRSLLMRLLNNEPLLAGLAEVMNEGRCRQEEVFYRLRGAGLVRRENGKAVVRCGLYARFLRERLHDWKT